MTSSNGQDGMIICSYCGRPVSLANAINGMGPICYRKHAQAQANAGIMPSMPYTMQEGDIPIDYSFLNTEQHQIHQVVFNPDEKKMKVQFTEDDYPCDLDLENNQQEQEVVYTLEPQNIEPSRFTESSYEGNLLKESYPFVSPITEDFKAETRTEEFSQSDVNPMKWVLAFPNEEIMKLKSQLLDERTELANKYETEKKEKVSLFGTRLFTDAPRVIDTTQMVIPENATKEQYEKIIQSIIHPSNGKVALEELNTYQTGKLANIIYQLSRRYQPAFQHVTKLGTFQSYQALAVDDYGYELASREQRSLQEEDADIGGFYQSPPDKEWGPLSMRSRFTGMYFNGKSANHLINDEKILISTEKDIRYRDYAVIHEAGHLVHDSCDTQTKRSLDVVFKRESKTIGEQLSLYGASDSKEMVAEAFADYSLNENPSSLSQEIMGLVEDCWKKQRDYKQVSPAVANHICQTIVDSYQDYKQVKNNLNYLANLGV